MRRALARCVLTAVLFAACVSPLPAGSLGDPGGGSAGRSAASIGGAGGAAAGSNGMGGTPTGFGGAGPGTGAIAGPGVGGMGGSQTAGRSSNPGTGGVPGCAPTAMRLANPDFAWNLVLSVAGDSESLFWVRHTPASATAEVVKAPVAGCEPIVIASAYGSNNSVAVDATHVYWSDDPSGTGRGPITDILKADLDGSHATTLIAGQPSISQLAAGNDGLYFTTIAGVMKVGLDGGTPMMLAAGPAASATISAAANVYWTTLSGEIRKIGVMGGADPVVLVASDAAPDSIAVDATHIYWVNQRDGKVMRISIDGSGQPESLVAPGTINTCVGTNIRARTVAVDTTGVYWTDLAGNLFAGVPGQPMRTRALTTVGASVLGGTADIVLDSTTVYWMTPIDIWKTAK